jgi:hypothetical protein
MQKLTEKHRFLIVDGALRFFRIRAKSRPETAAFAPKVAKLRAELREKREGYLEAFDERVAQNAVIAYLDNRLDRAVLVGLKRDLGVLTAKHPQGPALEKKLFQGVAPSVGMKPVAGEEQENFVATIVHRIDEDADFASLAPHAKILRKGQKELDGAIELRKGLRVKERTAQADLDDALDRARRFYNQLYPQLQLLFPDDPDLVETFFRDLRSSSGGAAAEADAGNGNGGGDAPANGGNAPA